jgi:hypothetical protein
MRRRRARPAWPRLPPSSLGSPSPSPAPSSAGKLLCLVAALGAGRAGAYTLRGESGDQVMGVLASMDAILDKEAELLRRQGASSSGASRFAASASASGSGSEPGPGASFQDALAASPQCKDWCACMASQMMYETTWSVPYAPAADTDAADTFLYRQHAPDDDIWLRFDDAEGEWQWARKDDEDDAKPTGSESWRNTADLDDAKHKKEAEELPGRTGYALRMISHFYPSGVSSDQNSKATKRPTKASHPLLKSSRDCPAFHTEKDCSPAGFQTIFGLEKPADCSAICCAWDGDIIGSGGNCEQADPCEKYQGEGSDACEKAEGGKCSYSISIAAFGTKCETSPHDGAAGHRAITNPETDARVCYEQLSMDPCTCHKSQCQAQITEKWAAYALVLQREAQANADEDSLLDYFQFAMDIAGMIPGVGIFADSINCGIYVLKEAWSDAIFSAISIVPGIGDMLGSLKVAFKGSTKAFGAAKLFDNIFGHISTVVTHIDQKRSALTYFFTGSLAPIVKKALDDGVDGVKRELLKVTAQMTALAKVFMAAKHAGHALDETSEADADKQHAALAGQAARGVRALISSANPDGDVEKALKVLGWQMELLQTILALVGMVWDAKDTLTSLWQQLPGQEDEELPGLIRAPLTWIGVATPVGSHILGCISLPNGRPDPDKVKALAADAASTAMDHAAFAEKYLGDCLAPEKVKTLWEQVHGKYDETVIEVKTSEHHCDLKEEEEEEEGGGGGAILQSSLDEMSAVTGQAKVEADKAPIKATKKMASAIGPGGGGGINDDDVARINEMLGQKKSDNAITDDLFHRRHPDLGARELAPKKNPGDKVLVKEWVAIWKEVKAARKNVPAQTMFIQLFDGTLDALHGLNGAVPRREHGIRLLDAVEKRRLWRRRKALDLE